MTAAAYSGRIEDTVGGKNAGSNHQLISAATYDAVFKQWRKMVEYTKPETSAFLLQYYAENKEEHYLDPLRLSERRMSKVERSGR